MKKVIVMAVVLVLGFMSAAEAQIFPWRWPASYRAVPAPARVVVPAAPATTDGGYRSYSYQPGTAPATVQGEYRAFTYQPPPAYHYVPVYRGTRNEGHSYENGINKALGRVN
jgi:hypothetical protein